MSISRTLKRVLLLSVVVVLAFGVDGHNNHVLASPAYDTVLADSGFRPDKNGFGFENYGNDNQPLNLTPADVRTLFGDKVCASISGDTCTLIPPAQQWMDELNAGMNGGHCDGMASVSLFMYSGTLKPSDYGQDSIVALPFTKNDKLTRTIAYYFSEQTTAPTYTGLVMGTPNEIVDKLVAAITSKSEQYVISLRKRDNTGGHAITPYAVVDKGNDLVWIMVYDNNFPKVERHIEVNRKANTWQYIASTNPSEPAGLYEGDADTKTLRLKPMSLRLQPQICEFCATAAPSSKAAGFAQAATQYNEIMLDPHQDNNEAELLITDDAGHKLGYQNGKFYDEIPGANSADTDSADLFKDNPSPVYRIPVGIKFTVTLDGSQITQDEMNDISMIGPGYDLAVEDIKVVAGESDTLTFSPDGKQISYKPSAEEAPTIVLGIEHAGSDYEFSIKGADVQKGAAINVSQDYDAGKLAISTTDTQPITYGLSLNRIDTNAEASFSHDGLTLDPGATAYIDFGKWDGKGDISIGIDQKSSGTVDKTETASNDKK